MPSRAAATEPRTTAGYRSSAASRNRPMRTVPPSVSRSELSTAWTDRPPVSLLLIRSRAADRRLERRRRARRLDRADPPDHPERVVREGGVVAHERLARRHGEHVGAQPVEDGQERRPAAVRDGEDRDHRRDADGDAHRGERRPQLAGRQAPPGDPRDPDRPRAARVGNGPSARPPGSLARGRHAGTRGGAAVVGGAPVGGDPPVVQLHAAGQRGREITVVRDHGDRGSVGRVEVPHQVHERRAGHRVQVPRGLVREDDRRPADEGAGDGHALALAAGELARPVACPVGQAHAIQGGFGRQPPVLRAARRGRGGRRPRCRAPTPHRAGGSAGRRSRSARPAGQTAAGPTGGRRARRPRRPRPPSPGPGCR